MKKIIIHIILMLPLSVFGQAENDYFASIRLLNEFNEQIENGKTWDELLEITKSDSIFERLNIIRDIKAAIRFEKEPKSNPNVVDTLFMRLSMESYDEFPFRQSGNLDRLLSIHKRQKLREKITQHKATNGIPLPPSPPSIFRKSIYPIIFEVLDLNKQESVPKLIEYLSENSATRCIVKPMDWDENSFYLSISDFAMELIEIITLCDFHDNAAFSNRLFSNLPEHEKNEKITQIEKWWNKTKTFEKSEAAKYFLDSIPNFGYSYVYTCNNLLSYGDTLTAKTKYRFYYEENRLPCRKSHNVGKILSDLGDDILMEDCLHDIYDYRCMADNGLRCVQYIFKNAKSHIPFDVLADIVSTERFSRYKRTRSKFIWYSIFNEIATTKNTWAKSIMVELLSIDEELKGSKIIAHNWKRLYEKQFEANFRVCDFSLYKLDELFPEMKISANWDDKESINKEIKRIIKKENGG